MGMVAPAAYAAEKSSSRSTYGLPDWAKSPRELEKHHLAVISFHEKRKAKMAECFDFRMARHYTEDELRVYDRKRKTPVVVNKVKPNERAAVGAFLQQRFDKSFEPFEPNDQPISDVLAVLDKYTENKQDDAFKDVDIFRMGYAGGESYQECWMEVRPGRKPWMRTDNQNPFAVYWDPNSKIRITREDAEFYDRDYWLPLSAMCMKWPEKDGELKERLEPMLQGDSSKYESVEVYKDRGHESQMVRNGRFRVTERMCKRRGKVHYYFDAEGKRVDVRAKDVAELKRQRPELRLQSEWDEIFWVLVYCPAFSMEDGGSGSVESEEGWLVNDEYHCQPRTANPDHPELIWPMLEFAYETMNGEATGNIEDQMGPNKLTDAIISNILHAAKHAATTGMFVDPKAFATPEQLRLFEKHWTDGDRTFRVSEGKAGSAAAVIPKGEASEANYQVLNFAALSQEEMSTTPKASKGLSEGDVPGILNQQRIDSAATQSLPVYANWKMFLKRRLELRYAYWRTYYDHEMVIRMLEKADESSPDWMVLNKPTAEVDEWGFPTGRMRLWNDINAVGHDVVIADSQYSPTQRAEVMQSVAQILQNPSVSGDPVLGPMLMLEFVRLLNVPQELKNKLKNYSQVAEQVESRKQQLALQKDSVDLESATAAAGATLAENEFRPGTSSAPPMGGAPGAPGGRPQQGQQGSPVYSGAPALNPA